MYLLDVSIRDLKYFCVLFVLFVFLFMLLASLRCYTSIFDGFIPLKFLLNGHLHSGFPTTLGGGDNPMGTHKSQNQGPWPPKPDTYDRYKVFCLKDHILSAKKKRGPSNITFWIFQLFWPIGGHWEKTNQLIKTMLLGFSSIDLALLPHWQHPG